MSSVTRMVPLRQAPLRIIESNYWPTLGAPDSDVTVAHLLDQDMSTSRVGRVHPGEQTSGISPCHQIRHRVHAGPHDPWSAVGHVVRGWSKNEAEPDITTIQPQRAIRTRALVGR